MLKRTCLWAAVIMSLNAWAQMPHEVLLLVNRQSPASMKVANTYAAARRIPACNLVYLDIPVDLYGGTATITPEQFTKLIWDPANAVVKERGLDSQILAWVYSVDFPIRVKTDSNDRKQMSVLGLTFVRNKLPPLDQVEKGTYQSMLFTGPNARIKDSLYGLSLDRFRDGIGESASLPADLGFLEKGLQDEMPLPSMMLGYTGENGNDVQTVLDTIERGLQAERTEPSKGFYLVMSDDVRSKCREHLYYPLANSIKAANDSVTITVTNQFPAGAKDVMGLMMGAETVDPSAIGSFAPGAMAEHLTSWAAEFQKPQTKLTEWLKAGATATAGTVVEPYSNPDKFASARFFYFYVSGCTMLESFYQSISCPLQLLLLGDPLARPYWIPFQLKLLGVDTISSGFTYIAQAQSRIWRNAFLYTYLLDGKVVQELSEEPTYYFGTYKVADGYHELRVVAYPAHAAHIGISVEKAVVVNKKNRSVSIPAREIEKTGEHVHSVKIQVGGNEQPVKVRLVCGALMLDEQPYTADVVLTLDELKLGEGPSRIQAVAVYADGMEVASSPLNITIAYTP